MCKCSIISLMSNVGVMILMLAVHLTICTPIDFLEKGNPPLVVVATCITILLARRKCSRNTEAKASEFL